MSFYLDMNKCIKFISRSRKTFSHGSQDFDSFLDRCSCSYDQASCRTGR